MNCPKCGHENPGDAAFCGECAGSLAPEIQCPSCGRRNPAGQKFCHGCASPLTASARPDGPERDPRAYTPKHLADKILTSRSALEGERKQVTVLFADVQRSMDLQQQMDPESWHGIIEPLLGILADGVHRFEGTVNQYTGDGVMALFGAPIAHEDHAQRACYAALQLREQARGYTEEVKRSQGVSFGVRIGLNSGEVVVGKVGDDLRMDYTAHGFTASLADRMQRLADPGTVYLSDRTQPLVEGYFQVRDLGDFEIQGVAEPIRVHELEGVGSARTRLDISRARGFSRFVGRHDEMTILEAALHRAVEGHGQVVGVVGEAGVGKSRLCAQFVERCRAKGTRVLEAHCSVYGKAVSLLPIRELLRDSFGISEQDSDQLAREKIAGRLFLLDEAFRETLPLVFDLLGVPDPDRRGPQIDPEARQRQLFAFVRRLVQAQSEQEPAVLFFDDLHWIDAASDGFLAQLVEATGSTRTLLLVNFRPEYAPDWTRKSYYQQLPITPLGPEEVAEMVAALLGSDDSVAPLPALIQEKTGGNPFFTEEMVQSLVESGALEGERGAYRVVRSIGDLEVPGTVQALLTARIDRLPEQEKQVLHTAAVTGRIFREPILRGVLELPAPDLAASLSALLGAEFIYEEAFYPEAEYAFKHPLTREAAYQSQLRGRRARTHGAVARAIEDLDSEKLDERAALLSHHWEAAGEGVEAARWNQRAALWAGRTNRAEELRHWQKVLDLLEAEPASEEVRALSLRACASMLVLGVRQGLPSEEAAAVFRRGSALAEAADDARSLALLHADYGEFLARNDADLRGSIQRSRQGVSLAGRTQDQRLLLQVTASLAVVLWRAGRYREGQELTRRVIERESEDLLFSFPGIRLADAMLTAWLGRPREAAQRLEQLVASAFSRGDFYYQTQGHFWTALCSVFLGDAERAMHHAQLAMLAAEKDGTNQSLSVANQALGGAHALLGDWAQAARHLQRRLDFDPSRYNTPAVLGDLAEAKAHKGDKARARETVKEALALIHERKAQPRCGVLLSCARAMLQTDGADGYETIESLLRNLDDCIEATEARVYEPFLYRVRAELAQLLGDEATHERELREAHRLFTEMGATGHAERVARELAAAAE